MAEPDDQLARRLQAARTIQEIADANPAVVAGEIEALREELYVARRTLAAINGPCPLCDVKISTGDCVHLMGLGDGRVGMPRDVWQALVRDRELLRAAYRVIGHLDVGERADCNRPGWWGTPDTGERFVPGEPDTEKMTNDEIEVMEKARDR